MKKLIVPLITSFILFLTSCLGDSDSSFSGTNQFGVVNTTPAGMKYLITSTYLLSFDDISSYSNGDAMFLSYFKGNQGNSNSGSVIHTNDFTIAAKYPNSLQKQVFIQSVDTTVNIKDGIGIRSITRQTLDETGAMLNRILFEYSVNKKDGENYDINFYYDSSKQVDRLNNALPADRTVVDVVLTKRGDGVGDSQTSSTPFVLNATSLRTKLQPSSDSFNGQQYLTRFIDFRYSIYDTATNKYKQGYTSSMMSIIYYPTSD